MSSYYAQELLLLTKLCELSKEAVNLSDEESLCKNYKQQLALQKELTVLHRNIPSKYPPEMLEEFNLFSFFWKGPLSSQKKRD